MKAFRQQMVGEARAARSDPRRFVFLFGAALAYLIVFGMLYTPNIVTRVPCVIYDAEQTALSRSLVQDFEASDAYRVTEYAGTEEAMEAALREKRALVALEIPPDFSKKAKAGDYATVLYLVNGSSIIVTNLTSSAAQSILADFSDTLAAKQLALRYGLDEGAVLHRLAPVSTNLRVLYNATQGYLFFFLIGLAMVAYQQGILFAVGAAALGAGEQERREAQGAGRWLLAKLLFYSVFAFLSFLLVLLFLQYVSEIPLQAPLLPVLGLACVFIPAAASFCLLFTSFFREEVSFLRAIILYPVPAFIFSGYTWPTESMPAALQLLAQIFPLSHLSNTMRELFLMGFSPRYGESVLSLLALGCLFFLGAWRRYRRKRT